MRIIDSKEHKKIIILEDDDELEISALEKNQTKVSIKCINSILHIDTKSNNDSNFYDEEEKAIEAMKNYLKNNQE